MPKDMSVTMSQSEQDRFRKWVDSLDDKNKNECRILMTQTIFNIARRAKMFLASSQKRPTSVLQGSIYPLLNADKLGGSVYTKRLYGAYVEFGTGTKVVAPADVSDYAWTFKGKGIRKVNLRARPYLFPAWRLGIKEMSVKLERMGFEKK